MRPHQRRFEACNWNRTRVWDTDTSNRTALLERLVLEAFDGVVYDLDGTLAHLNVAWDAVHADVADTYRESGVDPGDRDLWTLFGDSRANGLARDVEETMASHEREGARSSRRLPLADALAPETRPVGVCTLNSETAAHVALDVHDLADDVDAVVGRDTVDEHKPNPEPLLAAIDRLGLAPDAVVFVGDSERDEETATAAGTAFEYVSALTDD